MTSLRGKVVKGAQRGRDLGFPTANIPVHKQIEEGIFLAKVTVHKNRHPERSEGPKSKNKIDSGQARMTLVEKDSSAMPQNDEVYNALTFIGKAETFGEKKVKAESFLLDFSGDLYGKMIRVELLKKIRDNKKFTSEKELVKQMQEDLIIARRFFTPWC